MENSNRGHRYRGRAALRKVTTISRCYECGWQPTGQAVAMRRTDAGIVGYAGLVSCGRVWVCPVCNAKVMARRAVEIGAALTWATVEGLHVIWGSLTCRHDAGSDLGDLLDVQRAAWRHLVGSKFWRSSSATKEIPHAHAPACAAECDRKKETVILYPEGRVGYIRAAELTQSERNGWHPHFHPIILVSGSREFAELIADQTQRAWVEGVELAGGEARLSGAQQLKVISGIGVYDALAGYITKATYDPARLALETVWSQGKKGRGRVHSTSSHWELLAGIELGLYDDVERWWQLERATTGHRMITWSRGLRSFAGLADEKDDEKIAAEEVGTRDDTVCFITPGGWASIRDDPAVLVQLLDVLEHSGWVGLRIILDAHGVDYFTLDTARERETVA